MIKEFLQEVKNAIDKLNIEDIEKMADVLKRVRDDGGRLFIVGSGGGAGHASHACCDFRKLCGIESYAPYDNISELTARINDEGWETTITEYLVISQFGFGDCLFVLSVGGGSAGVSKNLTTAILYAHEKHGDIIGIVGNADCTLVRHATASVVISSNQPTPITEGLQSVIWHLLVTKLQINKPVWT
jgi:D-sedoheptulose 7-phosphate isomerase